MGPTYISYVWDPGGRAHCTKMEFMGYFQGHQVIFENFCKSCLKILPDSWGFRINFDFQFLLLKSWQKLSKHLEDFWQILQKLTFYFIKSPDLLNENSSGRLILKHPQTKPFVAFQWGPNLLVLIEKPAPAVGIWLWQP